MHSSATYIQKLRSLDYLFRISLVQSRTLNILIVCIKRFLPSMRTLLTAWYSGFMLEESHMNSNGQKISAAFQIN